MHRALLFAVSIFGLNAASARAGYLIGPTPYLSQADSPFDLSGLGTTMFLEDFEQGATTTPGLSEDFGDIVQPPGQFTDSVDADDGILDGRGNDGYSIRSAAALVELTFPPRIYHYIPIDIDTGALGFAPNQFGFVLTDGPQFASVAINLQDDERNLLKTYYWGELFVEHLLDGAYDGGTAEDLFFGIYEPQGITRVEIIIMTRDEDTGSFEMDHVQYGLAVPEPASWALALVLCGLKTVWVVSLSCQ